MTITFRNDRLDDFLAILHEVGQWIIDTGQEMWQLDTLTIDNLVDEYTRDNCYVLYVDQTPAATFILQWKDPLYYPDVPDNTAGFIHKLAIRRPFAGQDLFTAILDFCRSQCLARNIYEIQLETDATRPALLRFYERHGFQPTYQKRIHEFGQSFDCQYYVLPLP
ncbi:GNAT family N-acetyltransferase [Spirosoma sordidisoli]|uniref:GNAT family N-acetyltransferase n=1 Tax=Spirosoma sordidisoli TaxID=2502893 RepID=A0A4V1RWX4_9BACT|nr:GNAT family N-acetyltransferase [Spirosoma sordidisoli]RYC71778.1 GNAT family N-acetyltransferase [Spirosoma sordidisoli]